VTGVAAAIKRAGLELPSRSPNQLWVGYGLGFRPALPTTTERHDVGPARRQRLDDLARLSLGSTTNRGVAR